jgi:hypothetical protein
MRLSHLRIFVFAALCALTLGACSGGGGLSERSSTIAQAPTNNAPPQTTLSDSFTLSPSGSTHALKLPAGYSGTISIGPNRAPSGTKVEVGIVGALTAPSAGDKRLVTGQTDPFPIIVNIRFPFTLTLPVPSFSITFPSWVNLTQGTFDVALYDPTQPQSATNPLLLGKAVANGQTLTFTAPSGETYTFKAGVKYSLTIARDTGGANVVLPLGVGSNTQMLPANGTLGAPQVNTNSSASGYTQWTVIPFGPSVTFGQSDPQGVESLVVQSTQSTTLSNTIVNVSFNPSAENTPTPGTANTFVPDPNPTVYGPFDLTVKGNQAQFTVPNGLPLSPGHGWAFVVLSVTVCVPINPISNVFSPCDSSNPSNNLTSLASNNSYDVYVSDQSGLLTGSNYSVAVSSSTPDGNTNIPGLCTFSPEGEPNGDVPGPPNWPFYNDSWPASASGALGPNNEFDVNVGQAPEGGAACTFVVSYNGVPMASENIGVDTTLTDAMKRTIMHRMFARPPTKSGGAVVSGSP